MESRITGQKTHGISTASWELLRAVLDARRQEPDDGTKASKALEEQLARLLKTRTSAGDEALVVLLEFGLDPESNTLVLDEVIHRGARTRPFLERYLTAPPTAVLREYPPRMWKDTVSRLFGYEWALQCIRLADDAR